MASMRDIKSRIKSVGSTQQITKAMNLVATSKLQKSKMILGESRDFYNKTRDIIVGILSDSENADNDEAINSIFLEKRKVKTTAIIVLTSDRGLCGGYNANICKETYKKIQEIENDLFLIIVGSRGAEFFSDKGIEIKETYKGISEKPSFEDAFRIGNLISKLYKEEKVDEVILAYTEFESVISHIPNLKKVLPLDSSDFEEKNEKNTKTGYNPLMIYDPGKEEVLNYIIPRYINTVIYSALSESAVCEIGARMTSMDSATKNAEETIDKMTIIYNRARQGAITQEITEIVAGANAL